VGYKTIDSSNTGGMGGIDRLTGGLDSFADIMAHASQVGTDVVLNFGGGAVLTIDQIELKGLKDSDFHLLT